MTVFISYLAPSITSFIQYRKASDHWNESSYEINLKFLTGIVMSVTRIPMQNLHRRLLTAGADKGKMNKTTHADHGFMWLSVS